MKIILRKLIFLLLILLFINKCGNSILNPPKPVTPINPLLGFAIADSAVNSLLSFQYATCSGAEEITIGERKTAIVTANTIKFFKLTNSVSTDYVSSSYSVTSGSSSSGGTSTTCLYVGKEDLLLDTNSSSSVFEYPSSSSSSCSSTYSYEITKDKFRCIAIASYNNISISLTIARTTSSESPVVTSMSPTSGPVGTLVTLNGKNLSALSTTSIRFGNSASSATVESSSYTEAKIRVPSSATSGSVTVAGTSIGTFTLTSAVDALPSFQSATCSGAEEITIGETKTANVTANTIKFFKLTNSASTDYVSSIYSVTSGSISSGTVTTCLYVGKEDQLFDTNSGSSGVEYPSSSSTNCSGFYSYQITKDKFRCIAIASYNNISISLTIQKTTSNETPVVTSMSPTSGPVGTLVTLTGINLGSSLSSISTYFAGSTSSATVESSSYSEKKVRVPSSATSGAVRLGSTSGTSIGTFTLTTATMMTRSVPTCTFTSINANGGTAITFTGSQDDGSSKISIGFNFVYFGVSFDSIYVNTNGGATFLSNSASSTSSFLSSSSSPTFVLAPWWGDLKLDASSSIQYSSTGSAGSRVFTIEWQNYSDSFITLYYRLNFQIKLYEGTNVVEFIYGSKSGSGTGNSANVGIKNAIGGSGNFMDGISGSTTSVSSYNSATSFPAANTCYRFTP